MKYHGKKYTWKVGLFALVSIILLIILFIILENISFRKDGYSIKAIFNNISGLNVGADVQIHGVTRGKVKKISIKPAFVEVILLLDEEVVLKEDAYGAIYQTSLITNMKYIDIFPGTTAALFDTSKFLATKPTITFDAGQISIAIQKAENLIDDIQDNFDTTAGALIRESTNFVIQSQKTLTRLSSLLTFFENTLNQIKEDMQFLKMEMTEKSDRIDPILDILEKDLHKLDSALTLMIVIEDSIAQGKGTLGKIIMEDSLYYDLRRTIRSYEYLANDIRENPRKYINIEIF